MIGKQLFENIAGSMTPEEVVEGLTEDELRTQLAELEWNGDHLSDEEINLIMNYLEDFF